MFELLIKLLSSFFWFSGYIYGNALPPSLSAEEEKMYLERLENGDTEARRILIERNLRLVAHIAKKYSDEGNLDDFISIGTIGLIKGIDTYSLSKNCRLSPYASRCIENELLMTLRSNKKRKADVSIDDPIGTDKEGNTLSLADILPSDNPDIADDIWLKLEADKLRSAMRRVLSPNEIRIIASRYGFDGKKKLTQKEIASELGISRSYVSRIEKKCLNKLFLELRENSNEK